MRLRHWTPLLGFVLPTLVIGYGFIIPRSCIAGVNELTIGFATTVAGASLTYWVGVRTVLREVGALGGGRQCAAGTTSGRPRPAGS
jgi:ABC-type Fe3+ transport system permease subunit